MLSQLIMQSISDNNISFLIFYSGWFADKGSELLPKINVLPFYSILTVDWMGSILPEFYHNDDE